MIISIYTLNSELFVNLERFVELNTYTIVKSSTTKDQGLTPKDQKLIT